MPLTVSTPYKTNTLLSTSGTAFSSNGTPFAASDVGRCIAFTSGAAIGCIRKIIAYVSTSQVTLDYAFGVSPFSSFINNSSGLPFAEALPGSGDTWQMSYLLDDLDDGTNVIKHSDVAYTFVSDQTISLNGVFLYDVNKSLTFNSNVLRPNASSIIRLGDVTTNGQGKGGCLLIDASTGSSGFSSSTTSGDFHFYGGTLRASGASHFWRLYRGAAQIARLVDARISGTFGCRLQGSNSLLLRVQWDDCAGTFSPFNTITPFGGTYDCVVNDSPRAIFWNPDNGPTMDARGLRFNRLSSFLISAGGTLDTGSITLRDMDFVALAALPALYTNSGNKPNSPLTFTQRLKVDAIDATLSVVTDTLRLHITNAQNIEVVNATTTTGSFSPVDLTARQFTIGSTGNHFWNEGLDRTPFTAKLLSYEWLEATVTLPMLLPSSWAVTLIPDLRVGAASAAAALSVAGIALTETTVTLTEDVSIQQVFDFVKATLFNNPSWPNLLVGSYADFSSLDFVIDGCVLTGDFSTSGSVTFLANGRVEGTYLDVTGRHVLVNAPELLPGTRVYLVDTNTSTELASGVLSSPGFSTSVIWSSDHVLELRASLSGYLPVKATTVLTSTGATFLATQDLDVVYVAKGINGSLVPGLAADGPNIEIDINSDGPGDEVQLDIWSIYAWLQYYLTTPEGIASDFFGVLEAKDSTTLVIDQDVADVKLDNIGPKPVSLVGGLVMRKNGTSVISPTSGSMRVDGLFYVMQQSKLAKETTVKALLALTASSSR